MYLCNLWLGLQACKAATYRTCVCWGQLPTGHASTGERPVRGAGGHACFAGCGGEAGKDEDGCYSCGCETCMGRQPAGNFGKWQCEHPGVVGVMGIMVILRRTAVASYIIIILVC